MKKRIILLLLLLIIPFSGIKALGVRYITHVQDYGWLNFVFDGGLGGTTGRAKRMEALYIYLTDSSIYDKINYQVHVEDIGWMNWVKGGEMAGTNYQSKRIEAIRIKLDESLRDKYSVMYRTHVEGIGWMNWVKDGELGGTTGRAKRMEAIEIKIVENPNYVEPTPEPEPEPEPAPIIEKQESVDLTYSAHFAGSWSDYKENGETIGSISNPIDMIKLKINNTTNLKGNISYQTFTTKNNWEKVTSNDIENGQEGKNIEAIKISLTDELAEKYNIFYKVYVHKIGWLDWTSNGNAAGTKGYYYPIEALEVKLQEKDKSDVEIGGLAYKETTTTLKYQTHVSNIGWQDYVNNGEETIINNTGNSVEAFRVKVDSGIDGSVAYKTFVARRGWTEVVGNNTVAGTTGIARKIEAIQIVLTGDLEKLYDIYYRVHVSHGGWMNWASNGASAGCINTDVQIEAIQIKIIPKGEKFDGITDHPFSTGYWTADGKYFIDGLGQKATGFRIINGVKYYFNSDGLLYGSNVNKVIDVSSWQGDINWDLIKQDEDVDSVILRVGWGSTYNEGCGIDSKFERNIKALQRLGIPYSIYIYAYAETYLGTELEAKFIAEQLEKYNVPKDTYIWYDAEIYSISRDVYSKIIPYFFNELEKYGYKNYGIYGGVRQLDTNSGNLNDALLRSYPIWVSQYYKHLQYTGEYLGWQFSSTEYINGIDGYVDVSMFKKQ